MGGTVCAPRTGDSPPLAKVVQALFVLKYKVLLSRRSSGLKFPRIFHFCARVPVSVRFMKVTVSIVVVIADVWLTSALFWATRYRTGLLTS